MVSVDKLFRKTLLFGRPDRVPFIPGWPRESTLKAWHQQGLPPGCDWRDFLWQVLDMPEKPPPLSPDVGVSFKLIPAFEEKVLEHHGGQLIVQDWMGAITEISDEYNFTYIRSARDFVTRKWHAFPVKSRQDWVEKIQWRYFTSTEGRFPAGFEALCLSLA